MDRDGFVEFVQRTFAEQKTKGSKVVTRSRGAEITAYLYTLECDCAIRARGLYKPASATPETCSLSLTGPESEPGNKLFAQRNPWIVHEFVLCALIYARSTD